MSTRSEKKGRIISESISGGEGRPRILVVGEAEIRKLVALDDEALETVEVGFTGLAEGDATVPPIMMIEVPDRRGEVDVKSAYLSRLDSFAVKIASGFFENASRGLPTSSGLMVLLSSETGFPMAVLLDNGYLTDVRTAMAGAIAAKYVAPETVETVGVVGVGAQARFQVRALRLVRQFERVVAYGRRQDATEEYAEEMSASLDVPVTPAREIAEVVKQSDLLITATPSRVPLVRAAWLHPGLHITAVGSDGPEKQELEPTVLARADRIVCDSRCQCARLGELKHALDASVLDEDAEVIELGELTAGRKTARNDGTEITVCDLTGVGVQDTAIARLAYRRASEEGAGRPVPA